MNNKMPPIFITAKSLAEYLGITPVGVWKLVKQGLPHQRFGPKTIRFDMRKVQEWIDAREKRFGEGK